MNLVGTRVETVINKITLRGLFPVFVVYFCFRGLFSIFEVY